MEDILDYGMHISCCWEVCLPISKVMFRLPVTSSVTEIKGPILSLYFIVLPQSLLLFQILAIWVTFIFCFQCLRKRCDWRQSHCHRRLRLLECCLPYSLKAATKIIVANQVREERAKLVNLKEIAMLVAPIKMWSLALNEMRSWVALKVELSRGNQEAPPSIHLRTPRPLQIR